MRAADKCGVYAIEQVGTGRLYIGSSVQIFRRWYGHRRNLNRGLHHSSFLQNAWTKHGPEAFEFGILEECERADLLAKEQVYIDTLKPAFNVNPKADSRLGSKQRPEVRAQQSAIHRERLASRTHCPAGHAYEGENLVIRQGARACRECERARTRRALATETAEQREHRRQRARASHVRTYAMKGGHQYPATCPKGHSYDSENTAHDGRGRRCRTCRHERNQAARQARKKAT